MASTNEGQPHRSSDELSSLTIDQLLPLDNPLALAEKLTPGQIQDQISAYILEAAELRSLRQETEIRISNTEGRLSTLYDALQLAQDKNPGI